MVKKSQLTGRHEIKELPTKSLIPYEFNNRTHGDEQINRIANSIESFGFNQPIVIDEKNVVLVGHGRLLAAEKLGLEMVPTLRVEGLTDTDKRAYRILDNKLQNDSTWDFGNLELELGFLEESGFDLPDWGLDSLKGLFPEDEPEIYEDDGPGELPDEPYIKRGDLIELGPHRVLCGDSTSAEDVGEVMSGKQADACISDPPYNVGIEYENSLGDAKSDQQFNEFSKLWFNLACAVSATQIITPGCNNLEAWCRWFDPKHIAPWIKTNACTHGRVSQWWVWEPIVFFGKNLKSKRPNDVFDFPIGAQKDIGDHPCPKPLKLWCELVKFWTNPQELVYDPFLGSGTTLIAADQLSRICYGIEISPQYCQVIIERYQKHCEHEGKDFVCRINGQEHAL